MPSYVGTCDCVRARWEAKRLARACLRVCASRARSVSMKSSSGSLDLSRDTWAFLGGAVRLVWYAVAMAASVVAFVCFAVWAAGRKVVSTQLISPSWKGLRKALAETLTAGALCVRGLVCWYTRLLMSRTSRPQRLAVLLFGVAVVASVLVGANALGGAVSGLFAAPTRAEMLAPTGGELPSTPEGLGVLLESSAPGPVGALYGEAGKGLPTVGPHRVVARAFGTLVVDGSSSTPRALLVSGYRTGYCSAFPLSCLPATKAEFDRAVVAVEAGTDLGAVNVWLAGTEVSPPTREGVVGLYAAARTGLPWVGDDAVTRRVGAALNGPYDSGAAVRRSPELAAVYERAPR